MPNPVSTFFTAYVWPAGCWMGQRLQSVVLWPTAPPQRLFSWNFVSFILLGVAFSGWLLYFTDSFEVFGGLLALGGLLSWLAFALKIFPDDKVKELQKGLFGLLLEWRFAWAVYLGVLLIALLAAGTVGTIQLESVQGAGDYLVRLQQEGAPKEEDPERLPSTGQVRFLRVLPWWHEQHFTARLVGFPEKEITLRPWWDRETRQVPFSFLRPVVLVGSASNLIQQSQGSDVVTLTITIRDKDFELKERYQGGAVWIGCRSEDGIEVPAQVQVWWKEASTDPKVDSLLLKARPMAELIKDEDREALQALPPDLTAVTIRARLNRKGDTVPSGKSPVMTVAPARTPQDMIQLLPITKA